MLFPYFNEFHIRGNEEQVAHTKRDLVAVNKWSKIPKER